MILTSKDWRSLISIALKGRDITKVDNPTGKWISIYLNEIFVKIHISKYLQPIQNGPKQIYALSSFFNPTLECAILGSREAIHFASSWVILIKMCLNKSYKKLM